jgi:hypothetical protein
VRVGCGFTLCSWRVRARERWVVRIAGTLGYASDRSFHVILCLQFSERCVTTHRSDIVIIQCPFVS